MEAKEGKTQDSCEDSDRCKPEDPPEGDYARNECGQHERVRGQHEMHRVRKGLWLATHMHPEQIPQGELAEGKWSRPSRGESGRLQKISWERDAVITASPPMSETEYCCECEITFALAKNPDQLVPLSGVFTAGGEGVLGAAPGVGVTAGGAVSGFIDPR